MAEEQLEGTFLDKTKGASGESEVEALIAGALAELETSPREEKAERVLKATPLPPTPTPVSASVSVTEKAAKPSKVESAEQQGYEETFKNFRVGGLVKGRIARLDPSGALVDLGYKSDGLLAAEELPAGAKVGDEVSAVIEKLESKEGYVLLSRQKAEQELKWHELNEAFNNKSLLQVKVTSAVKGGLVADFHGIRGFIPASQVEKKPEQQLTDFVGQILPIKVIEVNRRQSKIVFSHRRGSMEAEKSKAHKLFDELEVGQVRKGVVSSLKSFGAFVDLGGLEGLIHLTELSWKRVQHPSEVLKAGQELEVFVLGVDQVNHKVALGLKELQPDPWAGAAEKYRVGQIVKAKVLRLVKFGAFLEIEEGLEGLCHISELSKEKVINPGDVVKPGDIVEVKILRILPEEQKIGLSIREVQLSKEKAEATKVTIAETLAEKERARAEKEAEIAELSEDEQPPE
jgi:ribosomal protein S1